MQSLVNISPSVLAKNYERAQFLDTIKKFFTKGDFTYSWPEAFLVYGLLNSNSESCRKDIKKYLLSWKKTFDKGTFKLAPDRCYFSLCFHHFVENTDNEFSEMCNIFIDWLSSFNGRSIPYMKNNQGHNLYLVDTIGMILPCTYKFSQLYNKPELFSSATFFNRRLL